MIRIGWFTPISAETGIASYSQQVLHEIARLYPPDEVSVVVFHPATDTDCLRMPFPMVEISDGLLRSDFEALFDIAVYHLGNNDLNHGPIFAALLRHPGVAVMHDHTYQHYLAGASLRNGHVGPSFGALVHEAGGPEAFAYLAESGVLACDRGAVRFTPWDTGWAAETPLCDRVARLALGAVVHSRFAEAGLGRDYPGPVSRLFMPRPSGIEPAPTEGMRDGRLHLAATGHIGRTKGLSRLVEAFHLAPALAERFRVTIAGFASDTGFLDALKQEIERAGLESTIDLRVAPNQRQFAQIMASADLFYNLRFPNTEGASLSLVEQLAHGRTVIAYRSGCFAEIPEDAVFHLDRSSGAEALIMLLNNIDANRQTLAARGAAARRSVEERTAERYATAFMEFLRSQLPVFQRRIDLFGSRKRGVLPDPDRADAAWLRAAMGARRAIGGLFDGTLLTPADFPGLSAEAKGRYVTLNLLDARTTPEEEAEIGRVFDDLDAVDTCRLLGDLVSCVRLEASGGAAPDHLADTLRPLGCNPAVWKILARLPGARAVPLALASLGQPGDPEEVARLVEASHRHGFRAAMRTWLREGRAFPLPQDVFDWLERPDLEELSRCAPACLGDDLLARIRSAQSDPALRLCGFHGPETIGIWTARKHAALFLNAGEQGPNSLCVTASSLREAGDGQMLSVRELRSGRVAEAARNGTECQWTWDIALESFAGPLQITFDTPRLVRPCDTMGSVDHRALGVLVERVTLA